MAENRVCFAKGKVCFVELKKTDLSGYTLIEGFPGMGLVGTIAAKYVIERLGFRQVGYIDSKMFVPIIRVHGGVPVHPSRIYANEKLRLAVLISEQIIPQFFTDELAKAVVDWINAKKIKRIISLSGIRALPSKEGKQQIYGFASDEASKKTLNQHGIEIIKEGITTGVTALIMLELKDRNIEAFSLLGNVQIAADYKAAASLIEKLSEMLELKIDTAPLLKEAKETEKALIEHLKQLKAAGQESKRFESDKTIGQTPSSVT